MPASQDRKRESEHLLALLKYEAHLGILMRILLTLAGLALVRSVHAGTLPRGAQWALGLYPAFGLLLPAALSARRAALVRRFWSADLSRALLLGASLLDLVFVSLLVFHSGGPLSEAVSLYGLLMFKVAILYPDLPEVASVAILCGPAYSGILYIDAGGWFFLAEPMFIWRYATLMAVSLAGLGLGWTLARYRQRLYAVQGRLTSSRSEMARQTLTLQQTAGDLSLRVQQLRMLQEGVRAINASLALEDLLTLIVTNASQVVHEARCALALVDEDTGAVAVQAVSDLPVDRIHSGRLTFGEGIAGWVVRHAQPVRIDRLADDPRVAPDKDWPMASLISVPLIATGRPLGALTATSPEESAFTDEDLEALAAFAAQAVIAVKNARLYQSTQERRSELEAMLRGIGDAVVASDARLRLTVLNPIAAWVFGVPRETATGQYLPEVIDHPELIALFDKALTGGEPSLMHEIALPSPPDEQPRFYQALASPVTGESSEPRGVVVVLRDITEQRELERVKSDFLSVVTHELKTPLHSIKGFVDIILMGKTGPVTATQRDFLETVKRQSEALQTMINDLLEFSRLEAGHIQLHIERVLVGQLVRGVVARLAPLADEAGIELINLVPGGFGAISGDAARLEQVVTNLISNAIKFTPQGSVTISAADLGNAVHISVRDTGIGIAPNQLERIFERFYQVDGTATRAYRGAGLGLTICKHIVEYHGGQIWAESTEGHGSAFHVILPKTQPDAETTAMDFTVLPTTRTHSEVQ